MLCTLLSIYSPDLVHILPNYHTTNPVQSADVSANYHVTYQKYWQ